MWARRTVDVTTEKVMNRDVPFAGEFEPVGAVPPVRVEVTVCEAYEIVRRYVIWRRG